MAEEPLTIELLPDTTRACISLNVSSEDEIISFVVQSDEIEGIMITTPNGTIFGKCFSAPQFCYIILHVHFIQTHDFMRSLLELTE